MLWIFGTIALLALVCGVTIYVSPVERRKREKLFIPDVTADEKLALTNAKVKYTDYRDSRDGIIVRRRHFDKACEALNKYFCVEIRTLRRKIHGVYLRPNVEEAPELAQYQVRVLNFNGSPYKDLIAKIVRETVLPTVRRNINVFAMGGAVNEPGDENEFNIFLNSAPQRTAAASSPDFMYGWFIDRQRTYSPSNLGVALVDERSGYKYGEVVGKSVYIFPKLYDHWNDIPVLAEMLTQAAPDLDLGSALDEILASIPLDGLSPAEGRRVTQAGFRAYRRTTATRMVKEILLPALSEDASLRDCEGQVQKKANDNAFHILYNARPAAFAHVAALPTGRGVPIATPDGELLGELFDKNLYIYSDVLGYGRRPELRRFAELLLAARRQVLVERSFDGMFIVDEQFAEECLREVKAVAGADLSIAEPKFKAADAKMQKALTSVRTAEQDRLRLIAFPEEGLGREYDALCRLKKIRHVRVTERDIVVTTDMLYCRHPNTGVVYRIGEFQIHIPLVSTRDLKFINKTQKIVTRHGEMNAPHVNGSGIACLGSTADQFPDLIRKRQYSGAAQLAILFLESVNPTDPWGKQINNWPVERQR